MSNKKVASTGAILAASVLLIGLIMRSPITTLPLMLTQISGELGVDKGQLGILTTIPLVMFLLISNFASKTMSFFGLKKALGLSLASIFLGTALRLVVTMPTMLIGTVLVGAGIAHLNVFMPTFVASYFSHKVGVYTSMYSLTIMIGSATFSLLTAPVVATFGWHAVMWLLVLLPAIVLGFWIYTSMRVPEKVPATRGRHHDTNAPKKKIWTNIKAWPFLIVFGVQAIINYTGVAWLPTMMAQHHVSAGSISVIMSFYSFIGMPISILVPNILVNMRRKGTLATIAVAAVMSLIGAVMLFDQETSSVVYWFFLTILIGFATSFFFLYTMTMFAAKTSSPVETARLSGMAQAGGYFMSAFGPMLYGMAFTVNPNGVIQNVVYLVLVIVMIVAAVMMAMTKHLFD